MKSACIGRSCEIYFADVLFFNHPFFKWLQKRLYRPILIKKEFIKFTIVITKGFIVLLDIDTISTTDLNRHTLYQEEHEALPISHTLV